MLILQVWLDPKKSVASQLRGELQSSFLRHFLGFNNLLFYNFTQCFPFIAVTLLLV